MDPLDYLHTELATLEAAGLRRRKSPAVALPDGWIDAASNDYLGLARQPVSRETLDFLARLPTGAGASRLIHGSHPIHDRLEALLAEWVNLPTATLFPSGYAANIGTLHCLLQPGDTVVSDNLNHASLIDGCRLARTRPTIVPHRDLEAVDRAFRGASSSRRWLLTETHFSMDGDLADLRALRALCDEHGAALLVDEAHALGVFGNHGAGLCAQAGIKPDILIGTLGKAVGAQGAFVAGSDALRDWLWNRARSYVFTTAVSPILAQIALDRVRDVQAADSLRQRLAELVTTYRDQVRAAPGAGPIQPFIVGDERTAIRASELMAEHQIRTQPIRPPTVPPGSSRLRLTLHAGLSDDQMTRITTALGELATALPRTT